MNHRGEPLRKGWFYEDQRKIKCATERCPAWGKYSQGYRLWCKGCAKLWGAFALEGTAVRR